MELDIALILTRLQELITAPYFYPDMIWMVTPLVITLLIMHFYFGRYSKEELGWDSFVGNTLVLFFVALDLLRHIYNVEPADPLNFIFYPIKTMVALIVAVEAIMLFFADFFHFLPKKLAYLVSAPLSVNLTAYVATVVVYSDVPFNIATLYAALILFFMLFIVLNGMKLLLHFFWEA